jgi:allantoate deiminase
MISGAGHDAQVFGGTCPTSLLFVPSRGGISHSPQEFTNLEDLEIGIELLTDVLYKLAY